MMEDRKLTFFSSRQTVRFVSNKVELLFVSEDNSVPAIHEMSVVLSELDLFSLVCSSQKIFLLHDGRLEVNFV